MKQTTPATSTRGRLAAASLLLLCALSLAGPAADVRAQAPAAPAPIPALRLSDGRILRNATFANFTTETVLVRHAGGSAVVRYEFLPEEVRAQAEQRRPGGPRYFAGATASKQATYSGQVYITTQGAGAYKFSGVSVYAFAIEHLKIWDHATRTGPVELPKPLAEATTDADGRFTLKVPEGAQFFVFAQASRLMADNRYERYEWRAPSSEFKKPDQVFLSGEWRHPYRAVKIEKVE